MSQPSEAQVSRITYTAHTILITGASSGIGEAFARSLAARGSNLVLVARRLDRLEALSAELEAAHGIRATAISVDLASPSAGADLRSAVTARGLVVTGVINNAGFGTFGPFLGEDPARLAQEIAVDVSAPVQLSHEFLPDLIAADAGFLINVASMAAYNAIPRMAVYGATKSFVLNFTIALWAELRGTGVRVFVLSPGATSTEFNDVVGTEDATAGARKRTPGQVVATALAHLEARDPGPTVIDGAGNRLTTVIARLLSRRMLATMTERLTDPARRSYSAEAIGAQR